MSRGHAKVVYRNKHLVGDWRTVHFIGEHISACDLTAIIKRQKGYRQHGQDKSDFVVSDEKSRKGESHITVVSCWCCLTAARAPRDGDLFDSKGDFSWYGWCAEYGKDELIPKDSVLVVKRVNTRQKLKGLCEDTKPLLGNVAYEASIDSPKVSEKIKKLDCTVILPRAQCDTRQ